MSQSDSQVLDEQYIRRAQTADAIKRGLHVVHLFENQRYRLFFGWSGTRPSSADPTRFTYASGGECTPFTDLGSIVCPPGWRWHDSWTTNQQYICTDDSGWSYGTSFAILAARLRRNMESSSSPTIRQCTRRRLWARHLQRIDGRDEYIPITDSTPISSSIDDVYDLTEDVLGKGGFSTVKLATMRFTKNKVAVKCLDLNVLAPEDVEDAYNEVSILRTLHNPNIVSIYDIFRDHSYMYIVLEYVAGGELFDRIIQKEVYVENEARDILKVLLTAIDYMHQHNVVHRDIKPENILMLSHNDDAAIKITDFGFAAVCTSDKCLRNPCGTPQYVAPEVLQGLPYGFPVDIWAIGVVAYILLAGYPPFYHDDDAKLFKIIMRGKFVFHEETWGVVSAQAKNFITCMLNPDPTARHTARQLLNHPWFAGSDPPEDATLDQTLENLKKFQALKKFRVAAKAVVAVKKLTGITKKLSLRRLAAEAKAEAASKGSNDKESSRTSTPTETGSDPVVTPEQIEVMVDN